MSQISKCVLIVLLVTITASCNCKENSQTPLISHQLASLLYSGLGDDSRWVIVEVDPWSQASRLWIGSQQNVCCPSRSLDGNQVAYFVKEEAEMCRLWIADFDGQNAVAIGKLYPCYSAGLATIEWSFDERYVAFRTGPNIDAMNIYILDTATGQEMVTESGWDFAWSKISNQLVMYKTREHNIGGLEVVDIPSGSRHWLLDVNLPGYQSLDWMPDQLVIIFSTNIDREVTNPTIIYTIDADGNNFHELAQDMTEFEYRDIGNIRVSPNGEHLLFTSSFHTKEGTNGVGGLMVLDLDSGKVRHLANGVTGPIAWSPDSKQVVFCSTEDPQGNKVRTWELFLVAIESGYIKRLTYNSAAPDGLTW